MNKNNKEEPLQYMITPQGSLGLLAYGDIGIRAWRKEKKESSKNGSNEEK